MLMEDTEKGCVECGEAFRLATCPYLYIIIWLCFFSLLLTGNICCWSLVGEAEKHGPCG